MNSFEKIEVLHQSILSQLRPLIRRKCILLDAPYYHNIGDVLIWEGEKCFLEECGVECLYTASYETCTFPDISKEITVLFNGGGNLGDIYHEHMDFLLKIVDRYPNNKIIVLPQTFYYQDRSVEKEDFSRLAKHGNIIFCARDSFVEQHLKMFFPNNVLLVPDMAFCINPASLKDLCAKECFDRLVIQRNDCEKKSANRKNDGGTISDWPVFEHSWMKSTFLNKIFKRLSDKKIPIINLLINKVWDFYAQRIFCKAMLREGVKFISPYKIVETTRLHGCILSILLNKQILLQDNSYSKNKHFYETWLSDLDSVRLI